MSRGKKQWDAQASIEKEQAAFARQVPLVDAQIVFDEGKLKQGPAVRAIASWLSSAPNAWTLPRLGVVLRGGVGAGKSIALAYGAWNARVPFSWMRPDTLVSAVLHSYKPEAPQLKALLVIDDLGRETRREFAEALCAVLDDPTITLLASTNFTKEQLRDRYEERILDRLCTRCIAFDVPGESMRKRIGDF